MLSAPTELSPADSGQPGSSPGARQAQAGPRLGFTAQFSAQGSFTLSSISSRMIEPDRHDNITTQPSATPNTLHIKLLTWHGPHYYSP